MDIRLIYDGSSKPTVSTLQAKLSIFGVFDGHGGRYSSDDHVDNMMMMMILMMMIFIAAYGS